MNYRLMKFIRFLDFLNLDNEDYDYYRKMSYSDDQLKEIEQYIKYAEKNSDYDVKNFMTKMDEIMEEPADEIVIEELEPITERKHHTEENEEQSTIEEEKEEIKIETVEEVEELEPITERKHYEEEKVSIFKRIKDFFNRKNDTELNVGKIPVIKERKYFGIRKLFSNIKEKFAAIKENINTAKSTNVELTNEKTEKNPEQLTTYKKITYVNDFISDNKMESEEVNNYIELLWQQNNDEKIDDLYCYVKNNSEAKKEENLLNKMSMLTSISRNKVEEKNIENASVIETEEIKEETIEIEKEEEVKTTEENKKELTEADKKFIANKAELDKKFIKIKMLMEDAHSEGLKLEDQEYKQMLIERAIDKKEIYLYFLELEKLKLMNAYNNLREYEKAFMEDTHSEGLNLNDIEYHQMAKERNINIERISDYYKLLEQSKIAQDKLVDMYKKESLKLYKVDFNAKKVVELKSIAKDNKIKGISKMNKQQLIDMLDQLKKLQEQQVNEKLGLSK